MRKTNVEELFPTNGNNLKSVVTNEVVSNNMKIVEVVEDEKQIDKFTYYKNYRNKLNSIYKMTNDDNSIISTFSFDKNSCNHNLIIRQLSGIQDVKMKEKFESNNKFINEFLIPIVEDYALENVIFDSSIEILGENQANFIVRTKTNDSLIIMGISVELANMFKDLINKKNTINYEENINEKGIGNYLVITLILVATGMFLIAFILFFRLR